MLQLIESLRHPQMQKVMDFYAGSQEADCIGSGEAVYDFFLDFFSQRDAFCAMWEESGKCLSVLRIQPYLDGVLLTGVETDRQQRGKGYAFLLACQVIGVLRQRGYTKLYSHVDRKNIPSQKFHKKCGFYKLRDTARLLDGTVTTKMDTLCIEL